MTFRKGETVEERGKRGEVRRQGGQVERNSE